MRYAFIDEYEVANGEGNGMSLFVQGCHFHCKNCFNSDTWDFNGGNEWTEETKNKFLELADKPYIKRISILGGEPLADENLKETSELIYSIRKRFGKSKTIWLYTGFSWDEITMEFGELVDNHNWKRFHRHVAVEECDVVVDGKYIDELRDLTLRFAGSKNQRVIDVQQSLKQNKVILKLE